MRRACLGDAGFLALPGDFVGVWGMLISPAPSWAGRVACLVEILLVSLGLIGSFRSFSPPPQFLFIYFGGVPPLQRSSSILRGSCVCESGEFSSLLVKWSQLNTPV